MASRRFGSLTKELPISVMDATVSAIQPNMRYSQLLSYARANTHDAAPGLLRQRFLLLDSDETVTYDRLLSIISSEGIKSPRVRKIMYFVWAFRDERVRQFICDVLANKNGKWSVRQLLNKGNSLFFENWYKAGPARKPARALPI